MNSKKQREHRSGYPILHLRPAVPAQFGTPRHVREATSSDELVHPNNAPVMERSMTPSLAEVRLGHWAAGSLSQSSSSNILEAAYLTANGLLQDRSVGDASEAWRIGLAAGSVTCRSPINPYHSLPMS